MNDKSQNTFLIVNVILVFAAMALELFRASSATGFELASSIILIFALASAAVYFFYGAKKNAAQYYRICVYVFAIPQLIEVGGGAYYGQVAFTVISAIAFGAICVLAEARDYGRIKSLVLGFIVLVKYINPKAKACKSASNGRNKFSAP